MKPQFYFFAAALFLLSGCTKDDDQLSPDPFYPAQETFKAPLFIEVYTPEGFRVSNAKVMLGGQEGYTDASGLLYLKEATVGASAYLTVEKEGYFHGSRRFYATPGKAQTIRIVLLSNSRIAFFNAGDGAVLPVDDHATIRFPSDGYLLDNGDLYEGVVVISAKSIAADDPDLSIKMPGDLVGVSSTGNLEDLGSLGMITVEMNTPDGDRLRFRDGTEAILEMEIPAGMADKAPSSIPLWYFDEYTGVWKEEGIATRTGDRYIGQVKHFSFWNYDAWFTTVEWGASFAYEDGSPASQVKVCITIDNLGASKCEYTDVEGSVRGMVAKDEVLAMTVLGACNEVLFESNLGPYSGNAFIGPVSITNPDALSRVSGYAVDCLHMPLSDGFVKISTGKESYYLKPDIQTGAFTALVSSCVGGNISVFSYNNADMTFSDVLAVQYLPVINTDTLLTCSTLEEYAIIEVEGFPNPIYFDSLELRNFEGYTSIRAEDFSESLFGVWFKGSTIGSYYAMDDSGVRGVIDSIQFQSFGPLLITLDAYGDIGEYVTGKVQGKVHTSQFGPIPEYLMTGRFSVRRDQ